MTSTSEPTVKMDRIAADQSFDSNLSHDDFDALDVVDLETIQIGLEPDDELSATNQGTQAPVRRRIGLLTGNATSWGTSQERLLRSRLLAVAIALSSLMIIASLVRYWVTGTVGVFFTTEHPSTISGFVIVLRMLICVGAAVFLASPFHCELRQLRWTQYFLIGGFVVTTMISQYFTNAQCVEYGEALRLALNQKNAVIALTLLLLMYASLIPDHPRKMTRVIMLVALWPTISFSFVMSRSHQLISDEQWEILRYGVTGNVLACIFAAGLSIYIAHVLNHLRKELHAAEQLGQYHLGQKLGAGGMGEVFVAQHQLLKRPCALKTIHPSASADPIALARFEREVQSTAMLSHPNTIRIYDYGNSDDGTFYYVMEFLSGMSAADLVEKFGPLPAGRVVYLIRQACQALVEAHQMGMIHRDLKPANLYVAILGGLGDFIKVLDYGLVKVTSDPEATQLTAELTVSGTPAYMSPEQATGSSEVDGRADIYALGGILYTLLTGRTPFTGANAVQLMIAHAKEPVLAPSQVVPGVPADLEAVVLKCLAKDPADRYPDAHSLDLALAGCQCAAEWDAEKARNWWLDQAEKAQAKPVATSSSSPTRS